MIRDCKELRMLSWMGLSLAVTVAAVIVVPMMPDRPRTTPQPGPRPEPKLTMTAIMEMYRQPIQLPPRQPTQPELDMAFRSDVERLEARARRLAVAVPDSARRAGLRDAAIILGR